MKASTNRTIEETNRSFRRIIGELFSGGLNILLVVVVFGGLGVWMLTGSHAATPTASLEAESGLVSSAASDVSDTTASGGHAVKFGSGSGGGLSGWPNASNVGLLVSTTKTMNGADIDTTSWFSQNGFSGSGTASNPYLVDRVDFKGNVTIGAWDAASTDLEGKYVKFTNCRFEGDPGNPTPGGSNDIDTTRPYTIAGLTIADSTLGPRGTLQSTGGPDPAVGGTDKGVLTAVSTTLLRDNIFGANIAVYFESNSTAGNLIQDSYIHDTWSSSGDHTDLINGNPSASHVTVRHNYLDGIRTGNSYVTNCFGIYNDAGNISDWTIDNNYLDRCATMILATTSTTQFTNPFVVTNNVFTSRFTVTRFSARSPSTQSNNKDESGNPLTF